MAKEPAKRQKSVPSSSQEQASSINPPAPIRAAPSRRLSDQMKDVGDGDDSSVVTVRSLVACVRIFRYMQYRCLYNEDQEQEGLFSRSLIASAAKRGPPSDKCNLQCVFHVCFEFMCLFLAQRPAPPAKGSSSGSESSSEESASSLKQSANKKKEKKSSKKKKNVKKSKKKKAKSTGEIGVHLTQGPARRRR